MTDTKVTPPVCQHAYSLKRRESDGSVRAYCPDCWQNWPVPDPLAEPDNQPS